MCGVYLNRARIALTVLFLPMTLLLLQTESVFSLLGFDPLAAHYSFLYIVHLLPGLLCLGLLDINRRFLVTMGYQNAPMCIQLLITAMHVGWCWVAVEKMEWGIKGTAIATTLTHFINVMA